MDKKAIARRSDALNADGVRYHRKNLCDMVAYLEADVEQLKEENAKLLKLVRWMYERMDESCAVHYPYAPEPISYLNLMKAEELMHELGIEAKNG